jgi:hypothetical protein
MKKLLSFLAIAGLLALLPVSAQEQQTLKRHNLKLAFEFGTNIMVTDLEKPEQIRENHTAGYYYRDGYYDSGFFQETNSLQTTYFGVKPEYFIFNNRVGIASGVRFTIASSELVSDRDNFFWKIKEDGLNTDYIRIDDIKQKSYLLGVPLEVRIFPNNRELPFQHYFKIGASFNWLLNSESQVKVTNKAMNKYEKLVHEQLPKDNAFSSFFYGAVGFKICKYKEGRRIPWGNIEFQLPYLLLTGKSFAFTKGGIFGAGFQCSFQIPIGTNVPMGSNTTNTNL